MIDTLRQLASAVRRPTPHRTLRAPVWETEPAIVCLSAANSPAQAVRDLIRLADLPAVKRTLVIPSVSSRPGKGAHPHLVAALLDALGGDVVLGVRASVPGPVRRRWERLAAQRGASSRRLGAAGWDRVELSGAGFLLDEVFLPAELSDHERVIAVSALGDEALALGFVREIAHPHSRLRARGTSRRVRLDAETASATRMAYVIDGSRLPGVVATNLAVWAPDPLSAELAGAALRRFIDVARGYESVTAWEHERVQAASELAIGPASGVQILLRVEESNRAVRPAAEFLANELSCRIAWVAEEGFIA